jgi:hypothetical protein
MKFMKCRFCHLIAQASHEYRDTEEVLLAKIKIFADLLKQAKNCVVYSGAGLSVASGTKFYFYIFLLLLFTIIMCGIVSNSDACIVYVGLLFVTVL